MANHRDYRVNAAFCLRCGAWLGDLGLEPSYHLYVEHIVSVFDEVWRVLREDGTCWLVLGDCYATGAGAVGKAPGGGAQGDRWTGMNNGTRANRGVHLPKQSGKAAPRIEAMGPVMQPNRMPQPGLKAKDLVGIPWRVAFALQDRGWWLRRDNIWEKPNPMPESTNDRCTTSHEYVFHLAKSERYFYDKWAILEEDSGQDHPRAVLAGQPSLAPPGQAPHRGIRTAEGKNGQGRNRRSVWRIATVPLAEPHFAAFPPALAEICIKAGTSERGVCPRCAAPWVRVVEKRFHPQDDVSEAKGVRGAFDQKPMDESNSWQGFPRGTTAGETVGWRPTCACEAGAPVPATVLDCFLGSGTTAMVADRLGRHCVGIELSEEYAGMARRRLVKDAGMFAEVAG